MRSFIFLMLVGAAFARVGFLNDAIGDFSIRLLKKTTCSNTAGNTVHSAYSISTALGMCLLGAKERTYVNMRNVLAFHGVNRSDIEDGFSDSVTELTPFAQPERKSRGFVVSSANRLLVNESFPLSMSYQQNMRNIFHASAQSVDFTNDGPLVQENINAFVSNKTHELIPRLLDQPLPTSTVMTLVNALYFKGSWEEKFEERPSEERFNAYENGSNQTAEWVGLIKNFVYAKSETLRAQLVEVPYISRRTSRVRASMVFILPDEMPNMSHKNWFGCDNFTWANIVAAIRSMKREAVDLTFPKFKLESKFSLREVLMDLGMKEPFNPRANFGAMVHVAAPKLSLDEVIHKAKMDVDEHGTEAAAATAVSVMFMSLPIPIKPAVKLTINRSFMAMIILHQKQSVVPLFTALVDQL